MAGTTYYIRAYATNNVGTGYGNQFVINNNVRINLINNNTHIFNNFNYSC